MAWGGVPGLTHLGHYLKGVWTEELCVQWFWRGPRIWTILEVLRPLRGSAMWFRAFLIAGVLSAAATAQTPIDIQPLNLSDASGTCQYAPNGREKVFFRNLSSGESVNGSAADAYSIHGKTMKYIGWFGIVRGISPADSNGD